MIITFILTFSSLRIFVWDSSVGEESTGLDSWVRKIRWRRDRLSIPVFLSFPCGSAGKESTHNAEDLGLIPGLGRFPWRRERLPPQVFWPGEFHGLYSPWDHKESDTTEWLWRFLLRSKCLLISWLESPSAVILEPRKIKSVTVSIVSPSICHEVMGPDAMIFVFWILSLYQLFHSPLLPSSRDCLIPLCFLP